MMDEKKRIDSLRLQIGLCYVVCIILRMFEAYLSLGAKLLMILDKHGKLYASRQYY